MSADRHEQGGRSPTNCLQSLVSAVSMAGKGRELGNLVPGKFSNLEGN